MENETLLVEYFNVKPSNNEKHTRIFFNLYEPFDTLLMNIAEYPTTKEQLTLIEKIKAKYKYHKVIYTKPN